MKWFEPNTEELQDWENWCDSRPPEVAQIARQFPPWELYRMDSGHRCHIYSYGELEDGGVSLTVSVTGQFNFLAFSRNVFDIDPTSLIPCELPHATERVGLMISLEDTNE